MNSHRLGAKEKDKAIWVWLEMKGIPHVWLSKRSSPLDTLKLTWLQRKDLLAPTDPVWPE